MKRGYKRSDRVTLSAVDVSDDLQHARVYFSTALSSSSPEEAQAGLERASGFLRREIGRRLDLRYAPKLNFHYDESFDRGARIEQTLRNLPDEAPDDGEE